MSSAYESLLLEMSLIQAEHHLSQGDDNNKVIQTGKECEMSSLSQEKNYPLGDFDRRWHLLTKLTSF